MKNFEKHIDEIAKLINSYTGCRKCPCKDECFSDSFSDNAHVYCKDFFKDWAMKEAEE